MADFKVKLATVPIVKAVVVSGPTGPQGNQGPAGPATTDASLLTSGTLPDARLSGNVVKVSDLLAELNEAVADLPQEDPQLPEKLWFDPSDSTIKYTGTYGVVGTSHVGSAWVS